MKNYDEQTILQTIFQNCDNLLPVLKDKKKSLHVTNQDISDHTGVPLDTVRKFFAGESKSPNVYNVMSICIYFNVSLDEILGNSSSMKSAPVESEEIKSLRIENEKLQIHLDYLRNARETLESVSLFRQKIIYALTGICSLLALFVCIFLIMDFRLPDVGLLQKNRINPLGIVIIMFVVFSVCAVVFIYQKLRNQKAPQSAKTDM